MSIGKKPRSTLQDRKRVAQHHRHSGHYMSTYWPYLPMALIISGGIFVNSLLSSGAEVLGTSADLSASSFLNITNKDRLADHERPLRLNEELDSAAQAKANDMVSSDYWSHTSPSGKTPWSFIIASGYQFSSAGENLAYGFLSANQVMSSWMSSPDHRANILNSSFIDVGFGVSESSNYLNQGPKTVIVAEYAEPSADAVSTASANVILPPSQSVSRLQSMTGFSANLSSIILSALVGAMVVLVVTRYGFKLKQFVIDGEQFILKHPLIDTAIVFIVTFTIVLGSHAGLIG